MRKLKFLVLFSAIVFAGCSTKYAELGDGLYADIKTNKGDIIVKLHYDKTPVTVANFVTLAEGTNEFVSDSLKGKRYYDGVIFHRVIKDFMIQGGDPTGTGSGGPGYKFDDEFVDSLSHSKAGILSMANAGPATNGSQFFITHRETPGLDGRHTVFGEVVKGIEVVDSIATTPTTPEDRPLTDVVMNKVEIIRNGKAAKAFDAVKTFKDYFAELNKRQEVFRAMLAETAKEFAAQKAEATETASGLRYVVLKEGTGEKPAEGATVMVNYAGFYTDATLFDTSWRDVALKFKALSPGKDQMGQYRPFPMALTADARLIPGFKEGLFLMNYGETIRLFIPSHLGYGPTGYGQIPPDTDLVFDIEISKPEE